MTDGKVNGVSDDMVGALKCPSPQLSAADNSSGELTK